MRGAARTTVVSAALSAAGLWAVRSPAAVVLIAAAVAGSLFIGVSIGVSVAAYVIVRSARGKKPAQETLALLLPWCQGAREPQTNDTQPSTLARQLRWHRRLLSRTCHRVRSPGTR